MLNTKPCRRLTADFFTNLKKRTIRCDGKDKCKKGGSEKDTIFLFIFIFFNSPDHYNKKLFLNRIFFFNGGIYDFVSVNAQFNTINNQKIN